MKKWYRSCEKTAEVLKEQIPQYYRSRTFSGIIGDIKALSPQKALSLISRKKGLGIRYAYLYLTRGIDYGRGYQACAAEALSQVLGERRNHIISGQILDVGCAVGVTAGILGLEKVTGFDLFPDLIRAAKLVDSFTGARHRYFVADMTGGWPLDKYFDTVVCGLVCHHLKEQREVVTFFSQANHALKTGGSLVITLPSGTVSTALQLTNLTDTLEKFGFLVDRNLSGMVLSSDSSRSVFWMFVIIASKIAEDISDVFISPEFAFPAYRTPVSREEKGKQAKETAMKHRQVKHNTFTIIGLEELRRTYTDEVFIFRNVSHFKID